MSEDEKKAIEIIKFLQDKCIQENGIGMMTIYRVDEIANAIETILKLIETQQKEIEGLKQDNKKLDKENQSLFEAYNFNDTNLLAKILKEYRKEIEELKQEKEYLNCIIESDKDNYINKDKIKSKIEEYDDKGMTVNLANRSAGKTFRQAVNYEVREVLQSLLEEV